MTYDFYVILNLSISRNMVYILATCHILNMYVVPCFILLPLVQRLLMLIFFSNDSAYDDLLIDVSVASCVPLLSFS